jgi:hypothetical protein
MANYKEQTGSGTSWTRAKQVIINNEYAGNKNITFFEENIAQLGDKIFKTESGILSTRFDPEYLISLRNPETGEKTGNVILQSLVYQALYSLYLDLAEARDLRQSQSQQNTTPASIASNITL